MSRHSGRVDVGDPAPDLNLVDLEGRAVRLSSLRGEAMVLVFLRHLA